jgi:hypothetical protein
MVLKIGQVSVGFVNLVPTSGAINSSSARSVAILEVSHVAAETPTAAKGLQNSN